MRAIHSGASRSDQRSESPPGAVSRRQFLTYAAVGAGALSLGGLPDLAAEPIPIASACSSTQFFLPQLAIETGPKGATGFVASPDIWAAAMPSIDAPPVTEFDITKSYFAVARIHNRGTAPVFNATIDFHEACLLCFPAGSLPVHCRARR